MNWRDSFTRFPYIPPTPSVPFYPDSLQAYLPTLPGFPPVGAVQQHLSSSITQSPRAPSAGAALPLLGGYLRTLNTEANRRGVIRPPSSAYLPALITSTLASGSLDAAALGVSTTQMAAIYDSLMLGLGSASNGTSRRNDPGASAARSEGDGPSSLPPPPPLKQAPRSKTSSSPSADRTTNHSSLTACFPLWHQALASADQSTAARPGHESTGVLGTTTTSYSWHKPVMSSSETNSAQDASDQSSDAGDTTPEQSLSQFRRVGDKYLCSQCTYTSSKAEKMRQHINAHSGSKICKICGKAFVKLCDLVRHRHAHSKGNISPWDLSLNDDNCHIDDVSMSDTAAAVQPLGSSPRNCVSSSREPSESVFRVLRPMLEDLQQAAALESMTKRPAAPEVMCHDGRPSGRSSAALTVNNVDDEPLALVKTDHKASSTVTSSSPAHATSDEAMMVSHDYSKGVGASGTPGKAAVTKSILEEILCDIVQHETETIGNGSCKDFQVSIEDGSSEHGSLSNSVIPWSLPDTRMKANNNHVEDESYTSASRSQPQTVSDTDILLALYGESLKKIPTNKSDHSSTGPEKFDAKVCEEEVTADNREERCDGGDDDDDDYDEKDNDGDDVLCLITKHDTCDESATDSGKNNEVSLEVNASAATMPEMQQLTKLQDGCSLLSFDPVRRHTSESGITDAVNSDDLTKHCDSSNEAGQSSTDADSISDSVIPLPEYASVGGSIVDLSAEGPKSLEQALLLPLALNPSLAAIHASPESLRGNSLSPRLRPGAGFRCSICNYEGRSEKSLQKHIRAHSSSYKICRYCSKAFERPSDLARHEERHERNMAKTGGDPSLISKGQILGVNGQEMGAAPPHVVIQEFRCKRCDFVTNRYHKLALHKRQKHSVKYCCKYCPMFFISALPLNNHMKRCPMKPSIADGTSTKDSPNDTSSFANVVHPEVNIDKLVANVPKEDGHSSTDGRSVNVSQESVPSKDEDFPKDTISGIGRLDTFKKSILSRSVLFGVSLGSENELILSTSNVGDEMLERSTGDIPDCTDASQAKILCAGHLCMQEIQCLHSASAPLWIPKVPSPFSIDLTASPPSGYNKTFHVSENPVECSLQCSPSSTVVSGTETAPKTANGSVETWEAITEPCIVTPASPQSNTLTGDDGSAANSPSVSRCETATSQASTEAEDSPIGQPASDGVQLVSSEAPLNLSRSGCTRNEPREERVGSPTDLLALVQTALTADKAPSSSSASLPSASGGTSAAASETATPLRDIPLTVEDMEDGKAPARYPLLEKQLGAPAADVPMIAAKVGRAAADDDEGVEEWPEAEGGRASSPPPGGRRLQIMRPNVLRHKPARYYCRRCNYGTDARQKMDEHVKAHAGRFICKHCNKACIKASDLYRHWVTHNLKDERGHYVCDTCDFASPIKHVVMNHLRVHYLLRRAPFPESHNIARCGLCGKSFTRSQLFVHKRIAHGAGKPARSSAGRTGERAEQGAPPEGAADRRQSFSCPACDKTFDSQTRVNSHYDNTHMKGGDAGPAARKASAGGEAGGGGGGRGAGQIRGRFRCSKCGRRFRAKRQLVCHQRMRCGGLRSRHNARVRSLNSTKNNNNNNINGQRRRNKYRCPYCRKPFRSRYYLTHHKKLHTGDEPYQCMKCGKKFSLSQACQNHIKRGCRTRRDRRHVMISNNDRQSSKKDKPTNEEGLLNN